MPRTPEKPAAIRSVDVSFSAACAALAPLRRGARLLLGCSGGGDSMALLRLAAAAARTMNWKLIVVTVDHRQRAESAEEMRFVGEQAERTGLEFFAEALPGALAEASPLSEDAMRQARHTIFRARAAAWQADAVLLAHQADDRAETFLIRLLAGSGPTGLGSIRAVESIGGLVFARPLLAIRREALRDWLRWHGAPWREDPSNASSATKRGWVRNALLPSISDHIGLDPADRIVRAAELIDEEAAALTDAALLLLAAMRRPAEPPALDCIALDHPFWKEASSRLRNQLLRQWLWELRGGHPPGYAAVAEAAAFAERGANGAELRTISGILIVKSNREGSRLLTAFPPRS